MKKLFLIFFVLLCFKSFAYELRAKKSPYLTTGENLSNIVLNQNEYSNNTYDSKSVITEICPVSKNACKLVINGGELVYYLKLDSVIAEKIGYSTMYFKVTGFDYNIIYFAETDKK